MLSKLDKNIVILIPALNPSEEFEEYIKELIANNFKNIVVVDDGSDAEYKKIFKKIELYEQCHIIYHDKNQGKGKSIKDGLKYFDNMKNKNMLLGVITVDCDGQHLVKDIVSVFEKMRENPNTLILGCRDFLHGNVPFKSSFGNKATSNIFKILYGTVISDTQTGLRGISKELINTFVNVSGDRYEYEMNMLIECVLKKFQIIEVSIETIYIDNNSNSHFRPIHDSLLIYLKILNSFIKYSIISIISCIIDIAIFKIFLIIMKSNLEKNIIILATIFARIISSFVNFLLNKKFAFNSNKEVRRTIIKYYILCIVQMIISGILVSVLYDLTNISEVIIKLIVDTILFFINYRIQRLFIFNK